MRDTPAQALKKSTADYTVIRVENVGPNGLSVVDEGCINRTIGWGREGHACGQSADLMHTAALQVGYA